MIPRCTRRAARAGGRLLARAAVFASLVAAPLVAPLVPAALAQTVTWEAMPGVRELPTDPDHIVAVDFLRGEGAQADDPAADTLVVFSFDRGTFLYNPSGAAGAAGDNGVFGPWHQLRDASPQGGLVTAAGTILMGAQAGSTGIDRGTDRGRTWQTYVNGQNRAAPFVEPGLPGMVGPTGAPVILAGTAGFDGYTYRTDGDGASGTWAGAGLAGGRVEALGVVPPSPSLPNGRVLAAVWNGVTYSDDGGLTYTPSSAFGQAAYIAWSFAFLPQPGHPYGGTAFAGVQNLAYGEFAGAEVLRSDDGGATWALAHHFTAAEVELPVPEGADVTAVELLATPDGALWAGVGHRAVIPNRGGVMRSLDGGATWERADAGFRDASDRGYRVNELRLSRTGVLYAATERGVWRTVEPVVSSEASPSASPGGVGVSVRPNPASQRVQLVVTLAAAGAVRVAVFDAQGREVAAAFEGTLGAGERVIGVDTSAWPPGVYVVRVTAGDGAGAAVRFTVAR